jgi:hypothetical protein
MPLTYDGSSWVGDHPIDASYGFTCANKPSTGSLHFVAHVDKAVVNQGQIIAGQIDGTFSLRLASGGGCSGTTVTIALGPLLH